MKQKVFAELSTWEMFAEVVQAPKKMWNGRSLRPDMVAYLDGKQPFAVIEVNARPSGLKQGSHQKMMQLFTYACAFDTPVACLANGEKLQWYRVDQSEGLVEIEESELMDIAMDTRYRNDVPPF